MEKEKRIVETFPEERFTVEIPKRFMEKFGKNWSTNKVTCRVLGIGEAMRISDQAMAVKASSDRSARVQYAREIVVVDTITKSVIEAPWKTGDRLVASRIPKSLAEWLINVIENEGELEEKKN